MGRTERSWATVHPSHPTDHERRAARDAGGAGAEARPSYYGVPVVHKPHWKWLIVGYFFLGGISGAGYVIAAVSNLVGPAADRRVVRAGRYISVGALLPCPVLLVLDLGRPERFIYMLRVIKLRSPMSVGTWGLTLFGACASLSAMAQATEDGLLGRGRLARAASRLPTGAVDAAGAPLGCFIGGYTGVLLAATAVPLWAKNSVLIGPLFLSSAFSNAAASVALLLAFDRDALSDSLRRLERLEAIAAASELALLAAFRAHPGPTIARPVMDGRTATLLRYGTVGSGLIVPLLLQAPTVLGRRCPSRAITILASVLVLIGGFILRYAVVVAGHASADDPHATFTFAGTPPAVETQDQDLDVP